MWAAVVVSLLIRIGVAFGEDNATDITRTDIRNSTEEEVSYLDVFLNETWNIATSAADYMDGKFQLPTDLKEEGRGHKLKYKKAELRFMMKALFLMKVVLGVILPFGIIASKILSWKAVTLSLMAFMLAKILFVKNLLTGKSGFSLTPNFVPPVFIQGSPNDLFWKRQGDGQPTYPWNSS